jgi:hypothetical protein
MLNAPKLAGIVLAFRRGECPYPVLQTGLHGLKPGASYLVELIEESFTREQRTMTGRELGSDFELRLPRKGTSLLVRYRPAKP